MNFEEFWENVNQYSSPLIRENFSQHAVKLLQGLLLESFKHDSIDIGVLLDPKNPLALLTHDQWNSNKQLSLRLDKKGKFDLYFNCYEEDDYQSAIYNLTEVDVRMIPDGLKKIMAIVVKTKKPVGAHKNMIENSGI